jgi:hypothetical protein
MLKPRFILVLLSFLMVSVGTNVTPATAGHDNSPIRLAQTAPADSAIKNAMIDLDRYEKQAASMRPGQGSSAKRMLKLLRLTESRLGGSRNKEHPSWLAANDRLQTLKQKLTALAAGKPPAAKPATAQPKPAPAPSQPAKPATAQPKAPAKPAPAAAQPAKPAQPAASESNVSDASEQRMKNALKRMRELEVSAEQVKPGMSGPALSIVKQLNALAKGLVRDEDQKHPRWSELVKRYQTLRGGMMKIAVDANAKRIGNVIAGHIRDLKAADPVKVQQAEETTKWRKHIADGRNQMAALKAPENANVVKLGGLIDDLEKALGEKLAFVPKAPVKLWSGDWPIDKPTLIDTIGPLETTVLVQMHVGRPPVWVPEPTLMVRFDGYRSDDVIVMQLEKDGKTKGKPMMCGARIHSKKMALAIFTCRPKKEFGLTEQGTFKLNVTYRQTLAQKEHPLASLILPVVELKHGSQNKPQIVFGDNMDARMNVSTIEEAGGTGFNDPANEFGIPNRDNENLINALVTAHDMPESIPYAVFRTWFKAGKNMIRTKLTCFYKDEIVAEAPDTGHNQRKNWSHEKNGRRHELWSQVYYRVNSLKIRPRYGGDKSGFAGKLHFLSENPGPYRCVISGGGEILKELHFEVGADGKIAKPACQATSMKTMRHVTLLHQVDKKVSFVPHDANAGSKHGFYGNVAWSNGCPPMK